MSKQKRVNPIMTAPPTIDKANFKSGDLPLPNEVNATISKLMDTVQPPKSKAKKETTKGTVVFSAMIEKELMKMVRIHAARTEGSMSEVLNEALREYFNGK
jgi:hypothetical protein